MIQLTSLATPRCTSWLAGYTAGMTTAVSLPDDVFEQAELLARRLKKSRSELYREALAEYVARHDPEAITEALDAVAGALDARPDAFSSAAARRVLERSEW
jgi:metal-responsive CopG/Arc/MetJ family transcriptional regulator